MRIARLRTETETVHAAAHPDGSFTALAGGLFGKPVDTGRPVEGETLAPLVPPTIYCIGLNYRAHAEETGKRVTEFPVVFLKSPTAVVGPDRPIRLPPSGISETVDYEAELAVVIADTCKNVRREDALSHVLGYACANDVSARNWQTARGGGQFCRAKTFDTFCPLGPVLATADEIGDPNALRIGARLNGDTMQNSTTADMIFDVAALIEFLSRETTLAAGTAILTGTPPGVGVARQPPVYLSDGDTIEIEIEGIGVLRNPVEGTERGQTQNPKIRGRSPKGIRFSPSSPSDMGNRIS